MCCSQIAIAGCIILTGIAVAQPSHAIARIDGQPPAIDGEVSADAAWEAAETIDNFTLLGQPNKLAKAQTRVKALLSQNFVYVAFICEEPQAADIVAEVTERDGPTYQDDCVEVFVAALQNRTEYYHFVVNAAGVIRDEAGKDVSWDSAARAETNIAKDLWTAELAIPIAALGLDETVTKEWGANFCRERRTEPEISCWAPCDDSFHEPANFGELTDITIALTPYVVNTLRGKAGRLRQRLNQLQQKGSDYSDLAEGRALRGACLRHKKKLEDVEPKLADDISLSQARSAGRNIAQVTAAVDDLTGRAMKLSMLRAAEDSGYVVCSENNMVKVRPERPYASQPAEEVEIYLARNEYEGKQIVVVPLRKPLEQVQVTTTSLLGPDAAAIDDAAISIRPVGYVEVNKSSGRSPMEAGLFPDPLLSYQAQDVAKDRVQSWWIAVHATEDLPAGEYTGKIIVTPENADAKQIPLRVTVWDFTLPQTSHLRTSYGINRHYVFSQYDIAPGPGHPIGWHAGDWTGADMRGIANYYGSMDYTIAFDTDVYHSGERSVRVRVADLEEGSDERPRFCYYTDPLDLKANTDYHLSVWYRTAGGDEHGPSGFFGPAGATAWPATGGHWEQGTYEFNTADKEGIRVYLKVDRVGTVWFDDLRLAEKNVEDADNVLPNPDFEKGKVGEKDEIIDGYIMNSIRHRASPTNVAAPEITKHSDSSVSIDWTEFDAKMQRYIDAGLSAFNVDWCRLPGGWGEVEKVGDEKRLKRARQLLKKTQAHLDRKGWTDLAYIYTIDEPGWKSFPEVKQAFDLAHEAAPKLKTLLTYGYGASRPIKAGAPRYAELAGYVDIHVPHSDCYEPQYLKKRQRRGDEVWAYVCISAKRPYLNNWGIDFPGMDHRLLFWQLFSHNIEGFLYWQSTYWKVNPWEDTLTYPGGNGDGSLLYPAEQGPVNSIRFELCRDGTEDYDMMRMLQKATAAANERGHNFSTRPYLQYPDLTSSWTEYSDAPEKLLEQRRRIGQQLQKLTRLLR